MTSGEDTPWEHRFTGHTGPGSAARPQAEAAPPGPRWSAAPSHLAWLEAELQRLLAFPRAAHHPLGGFAWLGASGAGDPSRPVETWITARMTYVAALAHLRGLPGHGPAIDHGVAALSGVLRDARHGGWHSAVGTDGSPRGGKTTYDHAFVVLAAASATAAGRSGAAELLADALALVEERLWDEHVGRCVEAWDAAWTECEAYRGANSNMHAVEAFLAAADVTGDGRWRDRALRIAEGLIDDVARAHHWRVVEHFDAAWHPLLELNADNPAHPFRPYGTTPGHWLEWARLLLHLEASLPEPPAWLAEAAQGLFATAVGVAWAADGYPGFPYTLDWHDRPVVAERFHWVAAEAVAAAGALVRRFGAPVHEAWYRRVWDHVAASFIDTEQGSWHHELAPDGRPSARVWDGKPDLYHAVQATLLPRLALAPSLAAQLAGNGTEPRSW